jgi:hypothetical protein
MKKYQLNKTRFIFKNIWNTYCHVIKANNPPMERNIIRIGRNVYGNYETINMCLFNFELKVYLYHKN